MLLAGPTASGSQIHADPFQILKQSACLSVLAVITEPQVNVAASACVDSLRATQVPAELAMISPPPDIGPD